MEKIIEVMLHNIPFLALMTSPRPTNRPLATRLSEQAIVAIVAAAVTLWVSNDRHEAKIETIMVTLREIKSDLLITRLIERDVAVNKSRLDALERRSDERDTRKK